MLGALSLRCTAPKNHIRLPTIGTWDKQREWKALILTTSVMHINGGKTNPMISGNRTTLFEFSASIQCIGCA